MYYFSTYLKVFFITCYFAHSLYGGQEEIKIGILGDSISVNVMIQPGEGFNDLLIQDFQKGKNRIKWVNYGISGLRTYNAKYQLEKMLNTDNPDIVMILLGLNDALCHYPYEIVRNNLEQMINMSLKNNAHVLLGIVDIANQKYYSDFYDLHFKEIYTSLANQYPIHSFVYLDDRLLNPNNEENSGDGVHPSAKGHQRIAQSIKESLLPIIDEINSKKRLK